MATLRLDGEAHAFAGLHGNISFSNEPLDALELLEKIYRPPKATTEATFTTDKAYMNPSGMGAEASAGLGRVNGHVSILEYEAKGPNVSVGAEASLKSLKAEAYARAELASASYSNGIMTARVGLGLDTGASIGLSGVGVSFLGTGFSIGRRTSISLFGNGFEFNF